MKRWIVALLAIVGGGIAAYFVTLAIAGGLLGILWLYVFGDDPWPAWIDPVLTTLIFACGLAAWAFFAWTIWRQLIRRA